MKTDKDFTPVMIKCPACHTAQAAIVLEATSFWNEYIHNCEVCDYMITESEWDEVKPFYFPSFKQNKTTNK